MCAFELRTLLERPDVSDPPLYTPRSWELATFANHRQHRSRSLHPDRDRPERGERNLPLAHMTRRRVIEPPDVTKLADSAQLVPGPAGEIIIRNVPADESAAPAARCSQQGG
jgi:hypothetical protein